MAGKSTKVTQSRIKYWSEGRDLRAVRKHIESHPMDTQSRKSLEMREMRPLTVKTKAGVVVKSKQTKRGGER